VIFFFWGGGGAPLVGTKNLAFVRLSQRIIYRSLTWLCERIYSVLLFWQDFCPLSWVKDIHYLLQITVAVDIEYRLIILSTIFLKIPVHLHSNWSRFIGPYHSSYAISKLLKFLSKDASFLHTTILTMCTAKKSKFKLEARTPLKCRLS
jgi:hypothetical protein